MTRQIVLLSLALVAGCSAGSGKGLDQNGRPIGEAPDPGNEPTLANIQIRVFDALCIQCHIGAAAPQGLRLDSVNAFTDLVGVPSREVNNLLRVEPFDPDSSYLVRKIEGTASVGARMPLGGPPVPDEDIMLIRQWITEGAMDTPAAATGQTTVQAVTLTETTVRIGLSRAPDSSTVHPGTITLTDTASVPVIGYGVAIAAMNPRVIEIRMPVNAAYSEAYFLSINEDKAAQVLDQSGFPVEPFRMEFRQ